jgi:hypothetical protein
MRSYGSGPLATGLPHLRSHDEVRGVESGQPVRAGTAREMGADGNGCGGWNRTGDTRDMSPLHYHCATPQKRESPRGGGLVI